MRQFVYNSLLLIITIIFTGDDKKICPTIKKSQKIMNMIVGLCSFHMHMYISIEMIDCILLSLLALNGTLLLLNFSCDSNINVLFL